MKTMEHADILWVTCNSVDERNQASKWGSKVSAPKVNVRADMHGNNAKVWPNCRNKMSEIVPEFKLLPVSLSLHPPQGSLAFWFPSARPSVLRGSKITVVVQYAN